MYYALNFVIYSTGVPMAKTAILIGIISMITMQSVSGASKINYNQDHVENVAEARIEQTYTTAKLYVNGIATDLANLDSGTTGQSDPYMEVIATDVNNNIQILKTPHRGNTNNPTWYDPLKFEKRTWKKMIVKIMDYDYGWGRKDDPLCPEKEISLESSDGDTVVFDCNPGTATVKWTFVR